MTISTDHTSPTNVTVTSYPVVGDESIMSSKAHGTSAIPVQSSLRWGADVRTADRICNYNRHFAEHSGYFTRTAFLKEAQREYERNGQQAITFYDSNTGRPLFHAPRGRTWEQFVAESRAHGWPSFRDAEVDWEQVRCLRNGEAVSTAGTHLGHNLPDQHGNRYCINLVSIAGHPREENTDTSESTPSSPTDPSVARDAPQKKWWPFGSKATTTTTQA